MSLYKASISLLILVTGLTLFAQSDEAKRREATEKELAELQSRIEQVQKRQQQNRTKLSTEQQALKTVDIEIGKVRGSLQSTRSKLRASEKRLTVLKQEEADLNVRKTEQQAALIKQIRSAYAGGQQEFIKLLLNQEDPSKLGRMLVYYEFLNKARLEKIQEYQNTLEKLVILAEEIRTEQQELSVLEADLERENQSLLSLKGQREQAIRRLSQTLSNSERELQELKANEKDLLDLVEALKVSVAQLIPEEPLDGLGKLNGKLNLPTKGRIREAYGTPRGNDQILWSGMLIAAPEGQPVSAIHHGRVVFSDYLRGFGLMTIIDHGEGYMSLYGHNESLFKQAGDWVEANETIATVGQTGGYPESGLYFEIRLRSKAINPLRYVNRR